MSLPYPIWLLSEEQKHSSADRTDREEESGGLGPRDPEIGPPCAPAYRVRSQGEEFDAKEKTLLWPTT